MSDAMSFAEVQDQHVELLPTRTVLSLLHGAPTGVIGEPGEPGTRGSEGPGLVDSTWAGIVGGNDASRLVVGITQPAGNTS